MRGGRKLISVRGAYRVRIDRIRLLTGIAGAKRAGAVSGPIETATGVAVKVRVVLIVVERTVRRRLVQRVVLAIIQSQIMSLVVIGLAIVAAVGEPAVIALL